MIDLYLVGGSGRIGNALAKSIMQSPNQIINSLTIYCDTTKIASLKEQFAMQFTDNINISGYSEFNRHELTKKFESTNFAKNRQIFVNLRGINNKQAWLNQPLDSLEINNITCQQIIDADLWMHSMSSVFHLSSLLCDLIESPRSLDEICEGQESYRRPYMVSRLHQETMLSAHAYQHSLATSFIRLPAVYGFADDHLSPWVLNSLCKSKMLSNYVSPRHPDRFIYLSHKETLIDYLRSLIESPPSTLKERTVNFIRPPMLKLTVGSLGSLIENPDNELSINKIKSLGITLEGDVGDMNDELITHASLLLKTIRRLVKK